RCRIYYNSAKFYSEMKDYQKSVTLSEKGIQICRDKHSIYLLDYLLYEKAFNKQMLGEDTADDYRQAYYFTQFFGNTEVLQYIEKDMKAFNISY
ncbi:Cro/Cl family transcriptional regulator, partial [Enterococcus faecalis]|nr:Cro/Cl family transcriptional regulator [Enterococcus faecalis]